MNTKAWDYVIAAGLIGLAVCFIVALRGKREDPVPKQLWGYWTTDAQGYENRYLELDDRYILVGVNQEDMPDLQRVSRVNCHPVGETLSCTLYSSNSETDLKWTLDYSPANGGEVRIQNQRGLVWHRQPSS